MSDPPRTESEPDGLGPDGHETDGHEPDGDGQDGLDDVRTSMSRLVRLARTGLALLVALGLVVPAGAWLGDELGFRRAADDVVSTLDDEGPVAGDVASTVLLVRASACPGGRSSTGTAFVVDTGGGTALLTNRHVVDDAAFVGVRRLDGGPEVAVTGVRVSASRDVAVLELEDASVLPDPLPLAADDPAPGSDVRFVGFPAASPFTAAGEVAEVADGLVELDLPIAGGASGSPVLDDDGRVVAQIFASTDDGVGIATAVSVLPAAIAESTAIEPC